MIPIHELLSRIRWDPDFGRGEFVLGYLDRVDRRVRRVALRTVRILPAHEGFEFVDDEGVSRSVPLHRIKEVWKDDELIWHREH